MEIFVNQLGYERDGPKRAVCRATEHREIDRFELHDGDDLHGERLDRFVQDQFDWILGSNPFGVCMLHGVGDPEPTYHRSYRNVPGGIQNGITAGFGNEDEIAYLPDGVGDDHAHRWRWAEQWIPHAAWAFLAVSSQ